MSQKTRIKKELYTPIAIVVSGILISLTLFMSLNRELFTISKGPKTPSTAVPSVNTQTVPTTAPSTISDVSLDDDPVLGQQNAKVTIVEFTDYQCPYCEKFFQESYQNLKKDYIDTGK